MGIVLFLIIFGAVFALGYPIAFGMIMGGIAYFITSGINLSTLTDIMAIQLQAKDVLLAVPLFILASNIMNDSEITDKIFDFVKKAMGPVRGGLGYANIVTSIIFAGISGSEIADVAGIGNIEIKAMLDDGYDGPFACAVTCASATISPVIPPSIPMVIYAMLTGASLGYLFLAGFLPGLFLGALEMLMVFYLSKKRKYPKGVKTPFRTLLSGFIRSFPGLLAPVILLVGIYGGIFTPTEAAAVVVGYVILVSFFIYKTLGLKKLYKILIKTVMNIGYISFMIAAAFVVSYVMSREQVPALITSTFMKWGLLNSKWLLLMSANVLYFILGMFIDVSVIQLVVIPMLLPLVQAVGIDLVHFGVVTTLNLMLALDTPPYGQTGYITSAISGTPVGKVFKEMLKYWIPLEVLALLIITYWPSFVLFIPRLFGYRG
ncbi:MAG: TRAP transporter large permease [Thermotogae bacterium]|uniref:TRAP transporter large permease n=1 Tax=Kosmotoga sp. TaxID=1955248 RepID=UPI000F22B3A9|nr:TRAP transporter large permease [Kosmotoga sp.]MCD6160480.1 TRAP transporter large permease [Kosmotoga sp.]RKX50314.1 MAG: TRAP transporter large permease [Thermotogota bacterium]